MEKFDANEEANDLNDFQDCEDDGEEQKQLDKSPTEFKDAEGEQPDPKKGKYSPII